MRKLKELTEEQELDILQKRKSGIKRKDIIEEYGISDRHYQNVIIKNGGELNKRVNKYSFNEDYFEKIDTEDKAYFLGFIVADGCVRKSDKSNFMKIKLKCDDYKILEEFIKYTAYAGGVYYHKNKKYCELTLSGVKVVSDLNNLGIYQNKTMIVKYPNIPKELEHHFMRGVFDGDGCISIHKRREGSRDTTDRGQVNICSGSIDFIQKYVDRLNEMCGITKNKIRCPKGTYNVIDWGSFSDIEKFYDFFYKDATVYLERKKKTFEVAVSISNSKIKYRKKQ